MRSPKNIRHRDLVDPGGTTASAWSIKLIRTEIDHRAGVAVVSAINHDHIIPARVRAREPQGQLIRFTATVDQKDYAERIRQQGRQTVAEFDQLFVQVTSIRI